MLYPGSRKLNGTPTRTFIYIKKFMLFSALPNSEMEIKFIGSINSKNRCDYVTPPALILFSPASHLQICSGRLWSILDLFKQQVVCHFYDKETVTHYT